MHGATVQGQRWTCQLRVCRVHRGSRWRGNWQAAPVLAVFAWRGPPAGALRGGAMIGGGGQPATGCSSRWRSHGQPISPNAVHFRPNRNPGAASFPSTNSGQARRSLRPSTSSGQARSSGTRLFPWPRGGRRSRPSRRAPRPPVPPHTLREQYYDWPRENSSRSSSSGSPKLSSIRRRR